MASLEELNNQFQNLQQTIQQQQEEINFLKKQVRDNQSDILEVEKNLNTKILKSDANLETQINRFNELIDKLKGINGETLRFAVGSTNSDNSQWKQKGRECIYLDIDTSSAGFSTTPYYFTSLVGETGHWDTKGATSIYVPTSKGFTVNIRYSPPPNITIALAKEWKWHIKWFAIGF